MTVSKIEQFCSLENAVFFPNCGTSTTEDTIVARAKVKSPVIPKFAYLIRTYLVQFHGTISPTLNYTYSLDIRCIRVHL